MRVGYVLESARIDGTVRFVARQARGLRERGHTVVIVCAAGAMIDALREAATQVVELSALAAADRIPPANQLRSLARALRGCDAVVAATGTAFPAVVRASVDAPVYLDLLSNDLFVTDNKHAIASIHEAAQAGRIFAHAYDDAVAQAQRYEIAPADVRLRALPVQRRSSENRVDRKTLAADDEFLILTATRLDPDHIGYVLPLIHAVTAIRVAGMNVRLALVGGGSRAQEVCAVLPEFVSYLNYRTDLDGLYPLADLYVGEGSTRLEAALAGVAVISSCAQTHPHLADQALFLYGLQHGTLHCYAPTPLTPPTSFQDALTLLITDGSLRAAVARRGEQRVRRIHALSEYLSWLEQYLSGRDAERCAIAPVAWQIRVTHDEPILSAARFVADHRMVGLTADRPIPWSTYASMPEAYWDIAADAARRATLTFPIEKDEERCAGA